MLFRSSSIVSTSSPPTPPTPSTSTRPESISAITNATTSNAQTPLNQTDGEPPAASTPKPVTPISSSSASNSSADLLAAPTKFDQVKNSSSSRSSLPSESEPKLVAAASEGKEHQLITVNYHCQLPSVSVACFGFVVPFQDFQTCRFLFQHKSPQVSFFLKTFVNQLTAFVLLNLCSSFIQPCACVNQIRQ